MERMEDFFASRVEGYEEHMLLAVYGCEEAYALVPSLLPVPCRDLLDLVGVFIRKNSKTLIKYSF